METRGQVQMDNERLLLDIIELRNQLEELYSQTGPNSSQYINTYLELSALEKEYVTAKIHSFQMNREQQLIPVFM